MKLTVDGTTYELRGGAWADEMNSCFWTFKKYIGDGYILCKENRPDGTLFAMYLPGYVADFKKTAETGKFKVIMSSWGGTERILTDNLTYKEAEELCDQYNWQFDDGGYIWDLYVEEM